MNGQADDKDDPLPVNRQEDPRKKGHPKQAEDETKREGEERKKGRKRGRRGREEGENKEGERVCCDRRKRERERGRKGRRFWTRTDARRLSIIGSVATHSCTLLLSRVTTGFYSTLYKAFFLSLSFILSFFLSCCWSLPVRYTTRRRSRVSASHASRELM